jgi:hypothetical protein
MKEKIKAALAKTGVTCTSIELYVSAPKKRTVKI